MRKIGSISENNRHKTVLDVVFVVFHVTNVVGKLKNRTSDQENFGCKLNEIEHKNYRGNDWFLGTVVDEGG